MGTGNAIFCEADHLARKNFDKEMEKHKYHSLWPKVSSHPEVYHGNIGE
jgi:hypothetical protein